MRFNKYFSLSLLISLLGLTSQAATITYTLNQDGCTSNCAAASFGTVTLTDTGAGSTTVVVVETLAFGERFAGTGAGEALEFNVDKSGSTFGSITSGFAVGPTGDTTASFGTFLQSISCSTCRGANQNNPAGPITFTVTNTSGLTINDFVANSNGFFFASNIMLAAGHNQSVASLASQTPEPGTIILSLSGMALIGISSLRKKVRK